jgi:transposase-like protein
MRLVGLSTVKRYADLRNFLLAGEFVEKDDKALIKLPSIDQLIDALKVLDACRMNDLFLRVPSYSEFIRELVISVPTPSQDVKSIARSAVPTYTSLAEMSCAALQIAGEGIVPTPTSPVPREFVGFALECYGRLRNGEPYVLTGKWLEELAKSHGIHPVITRQRLNEAREAGLIKRYTEGSTPETQYERHQMTVLEKQQGVPAVRTLNLYHGDFLIPGKASVSIRLEEASQ